LQSSGYTGDRRNRNKHRFLKSGHLLLYGFGGCFGFFFSLPRLSRLAELEQLKVFAIMAI
jgi:hypothetical protein